jgi:hypothetical protein
MCPGCSPYFILSSTRLHFDGSSEGTGGGVNDGQYRVLLVSQVGIIVEDTVNYITLRVIQSKHLRFVFCLLDKINCFFVDVTFQNKRIQFKTCIFKLHERRQLL